MQIKTTMRYYLTPVKMTVIIEVKDDKYSRRCGKKEPLGTIGDNVQLLWKTAWRFLKK